MHDREVERVVHADDAPAPSSAPLASSTRSAFFAPANDGDVRGGEHARDAAVAHDDAGPRAARCSDGVRGERARRAARATSTGADM